MDKPKITVRIKRSNTITFTQRKQDKTGKWSIGSLAWCEKNRWCRCIIIQNLCVRSKLRFHWKEVSSFAEEAIISYFRCLKMIDLIFRSKLLPSAGKANVIKFSTILPQRINAVELSDLFYICLPSCREEIVIGIGFSQVNNPTQ